MRVQEEVWKAVQEHLGYSAEEMRLFRDNQANGEILSRMPEFMGKTIVFEAIESCACNTGHRVGDRVCFDAAGNLLSGHSPKKVCIFALQAMVAPVFTCSEFMYEGMDPNRMKFRNVGCFDVGVKCNGWGRVIWRCSVVDRK